MCELSSVQFGILWKRCIKLNGNIVLNKWLKKLRLVSKFVINR